MNKRVVWLPLIGMAVLSAATLVAWAQDDEVEVTIDQVPAAVKATILRESAGGQIKEIEAETKDGKTTYEAEFVLNGKTFEIRVAADGTLLGKEEEKPSGQPKEQERKVTEAQVPPAALVALKKLAGSAKFTEFAEEIEHGHKFYEGSWKGPEGNMDALVTDTGDVVEIEEIVPVDKVPAGVRAAAEKEAGKGGAVVYERKTLYLYEIKFRKDGKGREMLFTADARQVHEEEDGDDEDEGEDEGEEGDD